VKIKLSVALAAMIGWSAAGAATVTLPAGVNRPAFFDANNIEVLSYQHGPGGLNVWTVNRRGVSTVLYTTADNKVLLSGVLWDAKSGGNLSDAFIPEPPNAPAQSSAQPSESPALAPQGVSVAEPLAAASTVAVPAKPGTVAAPIAGVSALRGVKEGNATAAKTLYILFDPRCPHCKNVYVETRDYVRKGLSIKWIPTTVLGRDSVGTAMVADVMQDPNPVAAMARVEMGGFRQPSVVDKATLSAIADNNEYFWAAFDRNTSVGPAGVPVGFFQTHAGMPQMVTNLEDPALLARIFKDIQQ
jgi:thiol:disulfide interchange protein DsbG